MGDPRNVAHAKKVSQEKHHKGKIQPVKKNQPVAAESAPAQTAEVAKPEQTADAAKLEKSLAVLAKLKELEFHSRGNIEKLAELSLTIEDELKQKQFVEGIGGVYSAEEAFHSKVSQLIEAYQAGCDRLKPAG
jgi:formamidopyrimidine-DNA glycosylase